MPWEAFMSFSLSRLCGACIYMLMVASVLAAEVEPTGAAERVAELSRRA